MAILTLNFRKINEYLYFQKKQIRLKTGCRLEPIRTDTVQFNLQLSKIQQTN